MDEADHRLIWAVAHSAAFRDRGAKWTKIAKILGLNDPRIVSVDTRMPWLDYITSFKQLSIPLTLASLAIPFAAIFDGLDDPVSISVHQFSNSQL